MTIERLNELITDRFGSQTKFARRLNVDKSTISKYLSMHRHPSIPVMRQIARILDIDFLDVVEAFYISDDATLTTDDRAS